MNKIFCKILFYIAFILGSLVPFYIFYLNGNCQALPDTYSFESPSLSVVEGGLNKTFDVGLSWPSNLFTIPIWTDQVLDPYLEDEFGWDTEDAAGYILEPLDPTSDYFDSPNTWGSILGSSGSDDQFLINQQIQNGFRLFGWSPSELGKLAKVIGTGSMLYFKGKIGEVTGKITDVGQNMLVKLGSNFSTLWGNIKSSLTQSGDIYNMSSFDFKYTNYFFDNSTYAPDYIPYIYLNKNVLVYNDGIFVNDISNLTGSSTFSSYDSINDVYYTYTFYSLETSYLDTYIINGVTYYYGPLITYFRTTSSNPEVDPYNRLFAFPYNSSNTLNDIITYVSNNGYPNQSAASVNYVDENGNPFDLSSILNALNGKFVTTDQLGQIKILIDNNSVVADANGTHQIFTDDSVQDLVDIINDILNQQDGLTDELSDTLPEPSPDPDPNPDPDFTWPEPPDYIPEWMYGPIPALLPEEMFSIFKPVFDIVGTEYSMHSTFIAIPAILIIAFIVYFIVSVL